MFANLRRSILLVALAAIAVLVAPGCAGPYPLHANLNDMQIRERLAANFQEGMPLPEVQSTLDTLRVDQRVRHLYPRTPDRPEVLLARLFPPGGFWLHDEDELVEFVDVSFVFDDADRLVRWPIYRDHVRYYQGGVAYGPSRPPMAPVRDFPMSPPPPADPLQGAQ